MKTTRRSAPRQRSGSALLLSLLLLLVLGGLTATLAVLNLRLHGEHGRAREDLRAFCVAEAGLNEALAVLLERSVDGVRALEYPRETSSGSYRVELLDGRDDPQIDLDRVRLRSVGEAGRDPSGAQYMVWHVPTGPFQFAVFGAEGVLLNSNVTVDSYDPADGPYPDKVEYVNDFGNVGSFEEIALDANVSIYGDALVSEDGVFDDDAPGIRVTGDQEAGQLLEDMPVVAVPSFPSLGALSVLASMKLTPGEYHYSSLNIKGATLTIQGPATLVVDDLTVLAKSGILVDTANGPVQVYATGNVKLASNSKVTTTTASAADFALTITSDNVTGGKTIELHSNSTFMGTIYAPSARLELPSNFEVFGAVKAAYVELASNSRIHFDEGLLYDPLAADVFELVSWRRLSQGEIRAVVSAQAPLP